MLQVAAEVTQWVSGVDPGGSWVGSEYGQPAIEATEVAQVRVSDSVVGSDGGLS